LLCGLLWVDALSGTHHQNVVKAARLQRARALEAADADADADAEVEADQAETQSVGRTGCVAVFADARAEAMKTYGNKLDLIGDVPTNQNVKKACCTGISRQDTNNKGQIIANGGGAATGCIARNLASSCPNDRRVKCCNLLPWGEHNNRQFGDQARGNDCDHVLA